MSASVASTKYAKALFDVTYQNGKSGETAKQLIEISKAFDSAAVHFFENPFNSITDKMSVLNNSLEGKCNPEVMNFLKVLIDNGRLSLLSEITKEYTIKTQESAGITKGKIFSAINLSEDFIKQVENISSDVMGKKIELAFEKDESLIAGYKLQVGGWTLDDSAQTHLKNLKEDLMKRGL